MDKKKQFDDVKKNAQVLPEEQSNQYQPLKDERQYISNIPKSNEETPVEATAFARRIKKSAWILAAVALISAVGYGMLNSGTEVDTSKDAAQALKVHMSTTLGAGTKLLSEDEMMSGQDHTITHSSDNEETRIWIWDYAAEDGDYVQVLVDGVPLGDPFMIKNKAVEYTVPTVGKVQVLGTRDGGGGITYGIYYELNKTTYFNGMDEGEGNLYTLERAV